MKERHELALVELCIVGDDAMTADCITAIYSDEDIDMGNTEIPQQCDEDDETAPWVKPCRCRGTTKWVRVF